MQRLIQRFDASAHDAAADSAEAAAARAPSERDDDTGSARHSLEVIGGGGGQQRLSLATNANCAPTSQDDAERVFVALGQLLGARNLLKLASVLRRYCVCVRASRAPTLVLSVSALATNQRPELAAAEQVVRVRFALAVLQFLRNAINDSIELSLRHSHALQNTASLDDASVDADYADDNSNASHTHRRRASQRLNAELRALTRELTSHEPPTHQQQRGAAVLQRPNMQRALCQPDSEDKAQKQQQQQQSRGQLSRLGQLQDVEAAASVRAQDNVARDECDDDDDDCRAGHHDYNDVGGTNVRRSNLSAERRANGDATAAAAVAEDPIKRALDCITGASQQQPRPLVVAVNSRHVQLLRAPQFDAEPSAVVDKPRLSFGRRVRTRPSDTHLAVTEATDTRRTSDECIMCKRDATYTCCCSRSSSKSRAKCCRRRSRSPACRCPPEQSANGDVSNRRPDELISSPLLPLSDNSTNTNNSAQTLAKSSTKQQQQQHQSLERQQREQQQQQRSRRRHRASCRHYASRTHSRAASETACCIAGSSCSAANVSRQGNMVADCATANGHMRSLDDVSSRTCAARSPTTCCLCPPTTQAQQRRPSQRPQAASPIDTAAAAAAAFESGSTQTLDMDVQL